LGQRGAINVCLVNPCDKACCKFPPLGETDPIVAGATEPGENVFGGVEVTGRRIVQVTGKEADSNAEFGTGVEGQPVQAAHESLVRFDEMRFLFRWFIVVRDAIDDHPGAIGAEGGVAFGHFVFIEHALDLGSLSDGDSEFAVGVTLPDVAAAEEPSDVTHEFNAKVLANRVLESFLNLFGDGEIGEIVDVNAEVNGRLSFNEDTSEYAGIVGAGCKTNFGHGFAKGVVPVLGTAPETVERLFEEPELAGLTEWAAGGRPDDDSFVVGECRMTEGVLAVTLLLGAAQFDGERGQDAVAFLADDRSIAVALCPGGFFVVAEGNDSTFGTDWSAKFIAFDGLNTHGRKERNVGILGEPDGLGDAFESLLFGESLMFFDVGLGPDGLVDVFGVH
jgi:hypothetical protein